MDGTRAARHTARRREEFQVGRWRAGVREKGIGKCAVGERESEAVVRQSLSILAYKIVDRVGLITGNRSACRL